ncbi:MAG: hypothetical protein AAGI27_11675 [Pseudomonadota bacterium]
MNNKDLKLTAMLMAGSCLSVVALYAGKLSPAYADSSSLDVSGLVEIDQRQEVVDGIGMAQVRLAQSPVLSMPQTYPANRLGRDLGDASSPDCGSCHQGQ